MSPSQRASSTKVPTFCGRIFVALALLIIGCVVLFQSNFLQVLENNKRAVTLNRALLSLNDEQLRVASTHISADLKQSPDDIVAERWWTYASALENDSASLAPIVEQKRLAGTDRAKMALLRAGDVFLANGDIPHLLAAWEQAGVLEESPHSMGYNRAREVAWNALSEGRWMEAEQLFNVLRVWRPTDSFVRISLAKIRLEKHADLWGAIEELEKWESFGIPDFWVFMTLGSYYAKAGRLVEAREQFLLAATTDPNSERPITAQADLLQIQGRSIEAVDLVEGFLKTHPENSFGTITLAGLYSSIDRPGDAAGLLASFLKRYPGDAPAMIALGNVYYKNGELDQAATIASQALQSPGSAHSTYLAWAHNILADIATRRGDSVSAAWHTQQAQILRQSQNAR